MGSGWPVGCGLAYETFVIHSTSVAVSREHRRAKTDRLDTEMLIRVFLGWLRGEPRHCKMVAIPTLEEEDARRPSRERESLVGERTRIINRMKAALIRLGVRGFKPELRKAPQRLEALRTAEAVPTVMPASITCFDVISGCQVACSPISKNVAFRHSSASALSTAGELPGQGPSSKVNTTSLSRRKSYCLKCSKPKPGPPLVSISTMRESPQMAAEASRRGPQ